MDEVWIHVDLLDRWWHRWLNVGAVGSDMVMVACGQEFTSFVEDTIEDDNLDDSDRCPGCSAAQSIWGN